MQNVKKEITEAALKKLFADEYFSIITIDSLLKMTNTIPDCELYNSLRALHCVSYKVMSEDLRTWLYKIIPFMFSANGYYTKAIENEKPVLRTIIVDEPKQNDFMKYLKNK